MGECERGAMCVRAVGHGSQASYDGWWRIEFGYGPRAVAAAGGSRHTKEREREAGREGSPPLSLAPSYTKQGETKEGGEPLTTPIWRRFRAPPPPPPLSRSEWRAVCVLWLVVSNVMVAVAMAHLKKS